MRGEAFGGKAGVSSPRIQAPCRAQGALSRRRPQASTRQRAISRAKTVDPTKPENPIANSIKEHVIPPGSKQVRASSSLYRAKPETHAELEWNHVLGTAMQGTGSPLLAGGFSTDRQVIAAARDASHAASGIMRRPTNDQVRHDWVETIEHQNATNWHSKPRIDAVQPTCESPINTNQEVSRVTPFNRSRSVIDESDRSRQGASSTALIVLGQRTGRQGQFAGASRVESQSVGRATTASDSFPKGLVTITVTTLVPSI